MSIHIKNAEADPGLCQVSADSHFDSGKALVGEEISPSNDGKDVNPRREPANSIDLRCGQRRSKQHRVGRQWRLQDHRFLFIVREAVSASSGN